MDENSFPDLESDLPDLTNLTLDDLAEFGDTVLGHALRRLISETSEPPIAGFQSSL